MRLGRQDARFDLCRYSEGMEQAQGEVGNGLVGASHPSPLLSEMAGVQVLVNAADAVIGTAPGARLHSDTESEGHEQEEGPSAGKAASLRGRACTLTPHTKHPHGVFVCVCVRARVRCCFWGMAVTVLWAAGGLC